MMSKCGKVALLYSILLATNDDLSVLLEDVNHNPPCKGKLPHHERRAGQEEVTEIQVVSGKTI